MLYLRAVAVHQFLPRAAESRLPQPVDSADQRQGVLQREQCVELL